MDATNHSINSFNVEVVMKYFSVVLLSALFAIGASAASSYNVTVGSTFEISVSDLPADSGITQFEKKPEVYITGGTLGTKMKKAKVLTKIFPTTDSKILCEWTMKSAAGTYDLYLLPKAKGQKCQPMKISSNFILEVPDINLLSPYEGNPGTSVTVTGTYFTKSPKAWFQYDVTKNGKTKTVKKPCKIIKSKYTDLKGKPSCMDPSSGASEFKFSIPKGIAAGQKCDFYVDSGIWKDFKKFNIATYTLSGVISGDSVGGVSVILSGDGTGTTTSATDGTFSFTGLPAGYYTITPSLKGYNFSPTNRNLAIMEENLDETNFSSRTVAATNTPPVAENFSLTIVQNQSETVDIPKYCSDPDLDPLSLKTVSNVSNGTVSTSGNSVVFTPTADFTGNASFDYTIEDGWGGEGTATCSIYVAPIEDSASATANESGGSVTLADTTFTFTPDSSFKGNVGMNIVKSTDADGNLFYRFYTDGAISGTISLNLPEIPDDIASEAAENAKMPAKKSSLGSPGIKDQGIFDKNWAVYSGWFGKTEFYETRIDPKSKKEYKYVSATGCGRVPNQNNPVQPTPPGSGVRFDGKATNQEYSHLYSNLPLSNYTGRVPVMFVHGYNPNKDDKVEFTGGFDYWGDFPKLLRDRYGDENIILFDFRWRSNARFQDVAYDLLKAINLIKKQTGQKVHIIAHSFGGLLVRTYLQGLAQNSGGGFSYETNVASLITLGTPHSGIASAAGTYQCVPLPKGQDNIVFEFAQQISVHQAGKPVDFCSNFNKFYGVSKKTAEIAASLSDTSTNKFSSELPVLCLIGMTTGRSANIYIDSGDTLITFEGQRFNPALITLTEPKLCGDSSGGDSIYGITLTEQVLGSQKGTPINEVKPGALNRWIDSGGYAHTPSSFLSYEATFQWFALFPEYEANFFTSSHATWKNVTEWLDKYIDTTPNTPPVADNQSVSVTKNTARSITLTATDANGDLLTYGIATQPAHGTLSNYADGDENITYTPVTDYTGTDSFTFYADDGTARSLPATVSITVSTGGFVDGEYIVVDLGSGAITHLTSVPTDLLSNTAYKSTKLVMRRITNGKFTMGSPAGELGRYSDETQHQVTLTKDYYIGVFGVTQKQYQTVMGSNPSYFPGDYRPVETVSWNTVRGGTFPGGDPGSGTFMDKLRTLASGYLFDLPTEAQREYACRAGTTTALNSGKNLTSIDQCPNMNEVGRYWYNGGSSYSSDPVNGAHTIVGSYLVNNWGLYDMHGNVWEWCLDWYDAAYGCSNADISDPVGASTGSNRGERGGAGTATPGIAGRQFAALTSPRRTRTAT